MSVRFYKIFAGVFLAHLIVLSVIWVGFSAPFPRPPATFTYEGALPAEDAGSGAEASSIVAGRKQGPLVSGEFALNRFDASHFQPLDHT